MWSWITRQIADENFTVCGKAVQKGDKGGWSEDNKCGWIQAGHAFAGTKIENSVFKKDFLRNKLKF